MRSEGRRGGGRGTPARRHSWSGRRPGCRRRGTPPRDPGDGGGRLARRGGRRSRPNAPSAARRSITARPTTGVGDAARRASYRARIWGQFVSAADGAASWRDAMAAWSGTARAGPPAGPGPPGASLRDLVRVPAPAILLVEQHQLAGIGHAGLTPRIGQEHQGQETQHLGLVGHEVDQDATQPDGFRAELTPDEGVPGRASDPVEDQVQHAQHAIETLGKQRVRWDAVRDGRVADLPLGADEALGQGRLRHDEGTGDLGRRDARPSVHRVRAIRDSTASAGWQHVKIRRRRSSGMDIGSSSAPSATAAPSAASRIASRPITACLSASDFARRILSIARLRAVVMIQASGWRGTLGDRPLLEGHQVRVLEALLGQVEVAEHTDQGGDRPPVMIAEQAVDSLA